MKRSLKDKQDSEKKRERDDANYKRIKMLQAQSEKEGKHHLTGLTTDFNGALITSKPPSAVKDNNTVMVRSRLLAN